MKERKYFIYIAYTLLACYSLIGFFSCGIVLWQHMHLKPELLCVIEGEINQHLSQGEIMRVNLMADVIRPLEGEFLAWGLTLALSIIAMATYYNRQTILEKYIKREQQQYMKSIGEVLVFLSLLLFWCLATMLTKASTIKYIFATLTDEECLSINERLIVNYASTTSYSLLVIKICIALAANIGAITVVSSFWMVILWFFRGKSVDESCYNKSHRF